MEGHPCYTFVVARMARMLNSVSKQTSPTTPTKESLQANIPQQTLSCCSTSRAALGNSTNAEETIRVQSLSAPTGAPTLPHTHILPHMHTHTQPDVPLLFIGNCNIFATSEANMTTRWLHARMRKVRVVRIRHLFGGF